MSILKSTYRTYTIVVATLILSMTSCIDPLDEEKIVNDRINQRIKEYEVSRLEKCRQIASEEAEFFVDSLIANWVGNEVMDTVTFPDRPTRPDRPDDIIGTVKKFEIKEN